MGNRVTQLPVEAIIDTDSTVRVTQLPAEAVINADGTVRVTQLIAEAVIEMPPERDVRITQSLVEVVIDTALESAPVRVTQLAVEALVSSIRAFVTQLEAEIEGVPSHLPPPVSLNALLLVDWNNDGDYADLGEDVTADLRAAQDVTCVRGKDQIRLLSPPMAGQFDAELDNRRRDYSVENTDSPLFENLEPGKNVRLQLAVVGEPETEPVNYVLFTGVLDDIPQQPAFAQKTVQLPALGSLSRLRGKRISTALYENIKIGAALGHLLDEADWPADDRVIDDGQTTLKWWWLNDEDAFDAVNQLLLTEGPGASVYEDELGQFVFEDRRSRLINARSTTSQYTFSDTDEIEGSQYESAIKDVINEAQINTAVRSAKPETVIWQYGQTLELAPNESREFKIELSDPFRNAQVPSPTSGINEVQTIVIRNGTGALGLFVLTYQNRRSPDVGVGSNTADAVFALNTIFGAGNVAVSGSSFFPPGFAVTFQNSFGHQDVDALGSTTPSKSGSVALNGPDGPYVEITETVKGRLDDYLVTVGSVVDVSLDRTSGASCTLTIVAGSSGATVENLRVRAEPVTVDSQRQVTNSIDTSESRNLYGLKSYSPSTRREITEAAALELADSIVDHYQSPRPIYVFSVTAIDSTLLLQQVSRQISDKITIIDAQTGINSDFYIERIAHRLSQGPILHTEFGCEKVVPGRVGGPGSDIAIVGSAIVGISILG